MEPSLRLLGVPHVVHGDGETLLPVTKATCLLVFLATRSDWVRRDELTLLFWPESDEASARHALRQLLYRARTFDWAGSIELRDGLLRWRVATDVERFTTAHTSGDWETATETYAGPFLDGVEVPDAAGFDTWRDLTRTDLHRRAVAASLRAAAARELRRDHAGAIAVLRRALDLDPLDEDVTRALLRCLGLAGERTIAEAVYTRFEATCLAELGARPSDATRELYERVRRGDVVAARPHNLPSQTTAFVGRELELGSLARRLQHPECRLITVVGPGGIGKTRLALQCASDHVGAYRNGVYLVALTDTTNRRDVAVAIADTLRLTLSAHEEPWAGLARLLEERELLLILDGMEQAREAAGQLAYLLSRAPGLRALVTSREPLGLTVEWMMHLEGLELPARHDPRPDVGSLRLFEHAAQRVAPGFSLRAGALEGAARVCHLVAGMPLAIELAASWAQLLAPDDIARAIEHDLDFLADSEADRPRRHQSLRSVFNATWARLDDGEQAALVRCAVFTGDVDAEALEMVAEATLSTVLALAKQSLLVRTRDDRFAMHPLVRQYARERQRSQPSHEASVRLRHQQFFADRVATLRYERDAAELVAQIDRDLLEVQQAWQHAAARGDGDALMAMLGNLSVAHDLNGRTDRFLGWLDAALAAGTITDATVQARLQARRAGCLHRLGRLDEAEALISASLPQLRGDETAAERCVALRVRGNIAYHRADLAEAAAAFEAALLSAQGLGDERLIAGCHNNLGLVAKAQGRLEVALDHLERALGLARRCDDAIASQALNNLATVHARRGDLRRAEGCLLESIDIKRRIGDHRGLTSTYANLGNLRARRDDLTAAEHDHRESLRVAASIDDQVGVARAHTNLAELAVLRGDLARAIEHFTLSVERKRANGEHGGALEAYARLVSCSLAAGEEAAARSWAEDGWRYATRVGADGLATPLRDACRSLAPTVEAPTAPPAASELPTRPEAATTDPTAGAEAAATDAAAGTPSTARQPWHRPRAR